MKIYVLIILCFYTIRGLFQLNRADNEDDNDLFIASLITIITGIIAIVFQSINL